MQAVRVCEAMSMPIHKIVSNGVNPDSVTDSSRFFSSGGYVEYKSNSKRIVDMFTETHFDKISAFLKSKSGERWASGSIALGKGRKGDGR